MKYFDALRVYNDKYNNGSWCVYKKGSNEYNDILKIMKGIDVEVKPDIKVKRVKRVKNEIEPKIISAPVVKVDVDTNAIKIQSAIRNKLARKKVSDVRARDSLSNETFVSAPEVSNRDKAGSVITKLFTPYIKKQSIDILDRIRYYIIIRRYLTSIKDKENCMNIYNIDTDTAKLEYRIGNKIVLTKQIGSKSAFGIVYIGYFKTNTNYGNKFDVLNKFAVKIFKKDKKNKKEVDILEELTKYVRMGKCPHFPITYGYLECNDTKNRLIYNDDYDIVKNVKVKNVDRFYPELISKTKKVYIVINELANGDLVSLVFKSGLYNDINKYLHQIFLCIMFFHSYTGLYHSDTHTGNFLYHKIKPGGYIHYNIYSKDYYVINNGYLWVIWDFGLSLKEEDYPITVDYYLFYTSIKRKKTILGDKFDDSYIKKIYDDVIDNYFVFQGDSKDKVRQMKIDILDFFVKNSTYVITDKPDNIINKSPYIIE